MSVKTTVVGAWVEGAVKNWFTEEEDGRRMMGRAWRPQLRGEVDDEDAKVEKMVKAVVGRQIKLGLDVVTDGEVGREGYYMHFIRNGVIGINLEKLSDKVMREGAFVSQVPTVVSKVTPTPEPWCYKEYLRAQAVSQVPVKYTLPGPMTIMDGSYNGYYKDQRELAKDLVKILQREVLALAANGCTHIQLDEPVMMRYPDKALEYGTSDAAAVFLGCPPSVEKTIHLCCGYPDRFEPVDYLKADKTRYGAVLMALDKAGFQWATIEDAEAQNDLSFLGSLDNLGIQLGAVAIARAKLETPEEIAKRAKIALKYLPKERLMLAPDCGLGFLKQDLAEKKLGNMVAAAKMINSGC